MRIESVYERCFRWRYYVRLLVSRIIKRERQRKRRRNNTWGYLRRWRSIGGGDWFGISWNPWSDPYRSESVLDKSGDKFSIIFQCRIFIPALYPCYRNICEGYCAFRIQTAVNYVYQRLFSCSWVTREGGTNLKHA